MAFLGELERVDPWRVDIPVTHLAGMLVPGRVYASDKLLPPMKDDNASQQVANVATLPGSATTLASSASSITDVTFRSVLFNGKRSTGDRACVRTPGRGVVSNHVSKSAR